MGQRERETDKPLRELLLLLDHIAEAHLLLPILLHRGGRAVGCCGGAGCLLVIGHRGGRGTIAVERKGRRSGYCTMCKGA